MDILKLFRAKRGLSLSDEVGIAYTANDPSSGAGESAPVGSILIRKGASGEAEIWQKSGTGDVDWEKRSTRRVFLTQNPTVNTDASAGFSTFDQIINTTTNDWFICVDNTTGSAVWKNLSIANGLPAGGSTNHFLKKNSNDDYDVSWSALPNDLPVGGTTGQVLAKTSNANYDVSWQDTSGGGKSFSKEYFRNYATQTNWDTWSNNGSVMYDRHGDPTFNNAGYQNPPDTDYAGAIWLPFGVTKVSIAGFLRQVYNKSGVTQNAGANIGLTFHFVRLNSNSRSVTTTFGLNAILGQTVNHQQLSQTASPNVFSGSGTLTTSLVSGGLYGIAITFTDPSDWEIKDAVMFTVSFEE